MITRSAAGEEAIIEIVMFRIYGVIITILYICGLKMLTVIYPYRVIHHAPSFGLGRTSLVKAHSMTRLVKHCS